MRNLVIMSVISIAVVAGITIWAASIVSDVQEKEKEIREAHEKVVASLRATNEMFPASKVVKLDPARFAIYVDVRSKVATRIRKRESETARNAFHARETRNEVLQYLHARLVEAKMSLKEYRGISRRWRALLAMRGPPRLREAWKKETRTRRHPEGLPLPVPPPNVVEGELALLSKHAEALEESMPAGLLTPFLDDLE